MGSISTYLIITVTTILVLVAEIIFSFYKKDGIYSAPGTAGNLFRGIIMTILSNKMSIVYFSYFVLIYPALGYTHRGFNTSSFLLSLVIIDFSYYFLHLIKHKISFLWAFHSVHHSDNKFNMSTYYRASWVEHLYMPLIPSLIALSLGFNLEIIFLSAYCIFIHQFYCHSQYIQFPKFLNYIFITPQTHIIHHDQEITHQNSNYGAMFCIWDRIFGTYVEKIQNITPGIKGYRQDNFIKMETDPVITYLKQKIG